MHQINTIRERERQVENKKEHKTKRVGWKDKRLEGHVVTSNRDTVPQKAC